MSTAARAGRSRRLVLRAGLGGVLGLAGAAAGGFALVEHGVLPGKAFLDRVDGACVVPAPPMRFWPTGPSLSGTFYSAARQRVVGYTVAYPPGHRPGSELPLIVALHAYGGDHRRVLSDVAGAGGRASPGWPRAAAADGDRRRRWRQWLLESASGR